MNTDSAHQGIQFDAVAAAADALQKDGKPVTIDAVREILGAGSPTAIQKHLIPWRASQAGPASTSKAELPETIVAALADWAQQFAQESGAGAREALAQSESDMQVLLEAGEALEGERDELRAQVASVTAASHAAIAERDEEIERLQAELRNARHIATEALVGKAKDQLAIDGKDAQLADLRTQLERYVASSSEQSDARLAAEMELVGAKTVRESLEAEITDLRKQLDASRAERGALRAELETLRARA
ncbi:DNA-binding protein [Massilia agilis]|uniref:DNA-binding protein n=1 Tax=Massilia agilis TaxID=1811226 RepID=A0ABT2DHI9_9BURK|nr:DNA-binding protein [Massilia agilis]MCS0809913.1 DNA-binding protein [Massilia agilis]